MIAYLGEWIKHIVLLILIATFLDLLLPNSGMRRYVKLVVGLLLILVILSPVLEIFKFDYERLLTVQEEWDSRGESIFASKVSANKERLEQWQEEAILEEVARTWAAEMKTQIEDRYEIKVADLQLNLARQGEEVGVEQLFVALAAREDVPDAVKHETTHLIEPVKPVVIEIKPQTKPQMSTKESQAETNSAKEKKIEQEVLTYLSEEWNISVDKMTCTWVRR